MSEQPRRESGQNDQANQSESIDAARKRIIGGHLWD